MSKLRSIVYTSAAVNPMSEQQLEDLLVESRRLNLETGTTGVLLYSEGSFMQCFEASEESSSITYQRIRRSPLHRNIFELVNQSIDKRAFSDWQMGFARVSKSELLALSTAEWQYRTDQTDPQLSTSDGMALLQNFWGRVRKTA